jgi:hypothetical protein
MPILGASVKGEFTSSRIPGGNCSGKDARPTRPDRSGGRLGEASLTEPFPKPPGSLRGKGKTIPAPEQGDSSKHVPSMFLGCF